MSDKMHDIDGLDEAIHAYILRGLHLRANAGGDARPDRVMGGGMLPRTKG